MKRFVWVVSVTLMTLGCSAPISGGKAAMHSNDLLSAGTTEITDLHHFFQEWFRGTLDPAEFSRFDEALGDDFVIVTPGGQVLEREQILEAVRGERGVDPEAAIEVRNIVLRLETRGTAVFTYEEWQRQEDGTMQGRLSTVVFTRDDQAPHGLRWRHVHETWTLGEHETRSEASS